MSKTPASWSISMPDKPTDSSPTTPRPPTPVKHILFGLACLLILLMALLAVTVAVTYDDALTGDSYDYTYVGDSYNDTYTDQSVRPADGDFTMSVDGGRVCARDHSGELCIDDDDGAVTFDGEYLGEWDQPVAGTDCSAAFADLNSGRQHRLDATYEDLTCSRGDWQAEIDSLRQYGREWGWYDG